MTMFYFGFASGMFTMGVLFWIAIQWQLCYRKEELRTTLAEMTELKEKCEKKRAILNKQGAKQTAEQPVDWQAKMLRLQEIGARLSGINAGVIQPSKNQTHSLYKNSLIYEAKDLKKELEEIVQELWDSGYNPTISIVGDNGEVRDAPLRELLADILGYDLDEEESEPPKPNLQMVNEEFKPETEVTVPVVKGDKPKIVKKDE